MTHSQSLSEKAAIRASRSRSVPAESIPQYTKDPFRGILFDGTATDALLDASRLLDIPQARLWFELFDREFPKSHYTYQLPLGRAAGAHSDSLGDELLMFSSYSYLGLIGHPRVDAAVTDAVERYGTSTGGVRLLTGTLELHHELEHELADFLGTPAAAVFSSGYDANVAAVTSLFGPGDLTILDQYAHQSIMDGCRMAGCDVKRFHHNDMEHLEQRLRQAANKGYARVLVGVDGVFSMDGDQAPLTEIIRLKNEYGAFLLLDEAHALGAIGKTGRGTCEAQGVDTADIDIMTGSLSKGIPSSGGFIAGAEPLKIYVQHGSAPYIFSAAITPPNAAAALEGLRILKDEPERMEKLRVNTRILRTGVAERGFDTGASDSPVVPLLLGDEVRAYHWARQMLEDGVFVSAVVHPAVSRGMERLRLCATAAHEPEDFDRLFEAVDRCE